MKLSDRDDLLDRLARISRSTPVPRTVEQGTARLLEQVQRAIGELSGGVAKLAKHSFGGPAFAKGSGQNFVIDARSGTSGYNVLSAANAVKDGLPNAAGFVVFRHTFGVQLDRYVITSWSLNAPAAAQPTSMGGLRIYAVDRVRTVFQLTADAESQKVVATLSCFASQDIPQDAGLRSPTSDDRVVALADLSSETLLA